MTFGERLSKSRKNKGLSQTALAKEMGFSANSLISRFEKDKARPSFEHLVKLSEVLNVDLHWLITGKDMLLKNALEVVVNSPNLYDKEARKYTEARKAVAELESKQQSGQTLTDQEVETLENNRRKESILHSRLTMLGGMKYLVTMQLQALLDNLNKG